MEGAVLHQADAAVIPQDPLAVLLPLDAGDGVAHDVTVELSRGTRGQRVIGRSLTDDGGHAVRRRWGGYGTRSGHVELFGSYTYSPLSR